MSGSEQNLRDGNPFRNARSQEIGVYPSIENLPRGECFAVEVERCPNFRIDIGITVPLVFAG